MIALSGVIHRAAPLAGQPLISGMNTSATPASAQRLTIFGWNSFGGRTVSFRTSSRVALKRAFSNGLQRVEIASSSPSRSHAAVAWGFDSKQRERRTDAE